MNVRLICIAGLARCLQLLAAGNCGSTQTNQSEVSIKIRGGRPGVEIKGLVTVCRSELVPFAPERIEDKVIALGDVSDSIGDRPPRA